METVREFSGKLVGIPESIGVLGFSFPPALPCRAVPSRAALGLSAQPEAQCPVIYLIDSRTGREHLAARPARAPHTHTRVAISLASPRRDPAPDRNEPSQRRSGGSRKGEARSAAFAARVRAHSTREWSCSPVRSTTRARPRPGATPSQPSLVPRPHPRSLLRSSAPCPLPPLARASAVPSPISLPLSSTLILSPNRLSQLQT